MLLVTSSPSPSILHFLPASDPPYKILEQHPYLNLLEKCKNINTFKQIHSLIIKTGLNNTVFVQSKLIHFCAVSPSGDLSYALSLFEENQQHHKHNVFIWNSLIRGYSLSSSPLSSLHLFSRMLYYGVQPNSHTFPFLFKSCTKAKATHEGKQLHAHALKLALHFNPHVHTSVIHMYASVGEMDFARLVFDKSSLRDAVSFTALITGYVSQGCLDDARRLFDEIPVKDVVSWNAMISGYVQSGRFEEAIVCFYEMQEANVLPNKSTMVVVLSACGHTRSGELGKWIGSWVRDNGFGSNLQLTNALIDMYCKCGETDIARELFDGIEEKDVISWNTMIGGYSYLSLYEEALALFEVMLRSNVKPNDVTFLGILHACACLGALDLGKWVHAYIDKNLRNSSNASLWTSLIDMYAKCGCIEAAERVFRSMHSRNLASWNAMLSGFAMHGHAERALALFSEMVNKGLFRPDDITFVGVLSACTQAGLVDLGHQYFRSMIQDYGISPKLQHYGCMIDLLARAEKFEEAEILMKNMEMEPDGAIWGSLLSACKAHGRVEFGEYVAERLFQLEPENAGAFVLLSNIYAGAGRWDDVARIRTRLNDKGMKKVPGCTSIEIDGDVHEFLVGDKFHPECNNIYKMLNEVDKLLEENGFVPNTSEVLYDMDEEWKEGALSQHSEKLAISFGLIKTKPGTTIRIVKNLRVCGNCHSATKLISKIFNREIIARDRNRFHHFKDGFCSCNDCW
ncbi:putative tetratricopeptide-like helical domain, DYW domain-containing protein [Medicago truncatula]|uniref:Organelle transcript processing protein, putative n=1 Tax=Medicago truncatula TaxID=3880 RepID=G7JVA7_MEDTR|nr:pentatricopeptide repeat-containing protein At1g08070, chloroplastic [Medicago truncatula]AES91463.1 organelle transcript processing protein, putative [Medicago truncatula]RHN63906.1 putative tetratricopeptide-like helical domain, DYW domain-containing protein [Medicago truncatula]